jgi:serine protease AprX
MRPTLLRSTLARKALALGAVLGLLLFILPSASAQSPQAQGTGKLSPELERHLRAAAGDEIVPVIVQTTGAPSEAHFARLYGHRGLLKARHESIGGYSASLPASELEDFAGLPEVAHVSFDSPVKAHLDVAYPAVKADLANKDFGLTGAGVGIALVDTGVYAHADLQQPLLTPQMVQVAIVGQSSGTADYYGHGTHVAGIINGNGSSSTGLLDFRTFKGIAPRARLISIRALYPDGTGYTSDIISGIGWAIKNKSTYNIRVLNLSLGHPVYESYTTDPLCKAVRAAYNAGIVVVAAAGNDGAVGTGFGSIDSPANEPSAITVGAMDDSRTVTTTDDVLSWYSSKGPSLIDFIVKPDLVAPGTSIVSLRDPGSYLDTTYHQFTLKLGDYNSTPLLGTTDGVYYTLSGTSMAAPFVTGAAALMIQKDPTLNPATVKARLMTSAVKDNRLIFETGAGELDVDAALKATGVTQSAMSPRAMLGSDGNVYVQDPSTTWGSGWPSSAVWGGGKGSADGIVITDVPPSMLAVFAAVWGGGGGCKAGTNSIVWNSSITGSGQIWTGDACSLQSTTGTVNNDSAVWGGGKN